MKTRVCEFTCVLKNGQFHNIPTDAGNFHKWGKTVLMENNDGNVLLLDVAIVERVGGQDHGQVVLVPPEALVFRD